MLHQQCIIYTAIMQHKTHKKPDIKLNVVLITRELFLNVEIYAKV